MRVSERVHYCSIEGMALLSFSKKVTTTCTLGWAEVKCLCFGLSSSLLEYLRLVDCFACGGLTFYKCAARCGVVSQCCQQRVVSFFSAISAELISYEASSVDWLSVVVVVVVVLLFVVASATAAVAFVVIIAIVVVVVSTNDEAR